MGDQWSDPRPSWNAILAQHGITPGLIARLVQGLSTLSYEEALQMVREARGTPTRIDIALQAFSRLAKGYYSRRNVGGFTFIASEGDAQEEVNIPADTLEHILKSMRRHGMVIHDTVYPPAQFSGIPTAYLIVSFPLGTLLAFEKPGISSPQASTPDDLMAYFPDGYILHTHLTLAWGIAYHVVVSQQEGAADSLRASREQSKDEA